MAACCMGVQASTLAEILGDLQINTSKLLARQQLCGHPQRDTVSG